MEMEIEALLICKNRKDKLLAHGIVTYFLEKDVLVNLSINWCSHWIELVKIAGKSIVFILLSYFGLFLRQTLIGLVILKYLDIWDLFKLYT